MNIKSDALINIQIIKGIQRGFLRQQLIYILPKSAKYTPALFPRRLLSVRSFQETLDPSYKFSSSTLQFRGRLELLLCRGGTIDRHVGTIHATHRERYRRATHLGTFDLQVRVSSVCVREHACTSRRARVVDTRRIMGGTLMDGVWVPPGTMERTSPSYHPSLSESFIAAPDVHIYIYVYTNLYIRTYVHIYMRVCMYRSALTPPNTLLDVPVSFTHSLLSNQSGFKSIAGRDGPCYACARTCVSSFQASVSSLWLASFSMYM